MNTVSKRTNCAIKSNLTDEFVDNIETNLNTKKQFKQNYIKLLANKQWYADQINVNFKMFEYNDYFHVELR